jgi:hypothetical protein
MKPISPFIRVLSSGKDENIKKIERNLGKTGRVRWRGWNQIWTRGGTTGSVLGSREKFLGLPMEFVQRIRVGEGGWIPSFGESPFPIQPRWSPLIH